MRTSLVPGMLDMLAWNLNRDVADARLFEIGGVYEPSGAERVEPRRACLGSDASPLSREALPVGWHARCQQRRAAAAARGVPRLQRAMWRICSQLFAGEIIYDRQPPSISIPGRSARLS